MLRLVDIIVVLIYLAGVVAFGCWFVRKSRSADQFMAAGRSLPGWAVGLSIYGTYLSSNMENLTSNPRAREHSRRTSEVSITGP